MRQRWFTAGDVVVVVLLALAGFAGYLFARRPGGSGRCLVTSQQGESTISLPADTVLVVTGPVGRSVVEISGERARVLASDCPGKLCVRAGWISRPGQAAVCVPNRLSIRLLADGDEGEPDAVTR